jgi:hypothetical protein
MLGLTNANFFIFLSAGQGNVKIDFSQFFTELQNDSWTALAATAKALPSWKEGTKEQPMLLKSPQEPQCVITKTNMSCRKLKNPQVKLWILKQHKLQIHPPWGVQSQKHLR